MSEKSEHDDGLFSPTTPVTSEHELLVSGLLSDPEKQEALAWLKGNFRRHLGSSMTNTDSVQLVEKIYDLGGTEVLVVRIQSNQKWEGQHSNRLLVRLPPAPVVRRAIFDWCKQQGKSLGFSPEADGGESYLFLLLN